MPRKKAQYGTASPKALTRESALDRALALRHQGTTYREITLILNEGLEPHDKKWTQRSVHKMITDYLDKVASSNRESANHLIDLQHARLEGMYSALKRKIDSGDARSIEVGIRLLERQSKLHGLDAPVKQEVKVSHDDLTDPEVLALLDTLKAQVALVPPPPVAGLLPGETAIPDAILAAHSPHSPPIIDVEIETLQPPVPQGPQGPTTTS